MRAKPKTGLVGRRPSGLYTTPRRIDRRTPFADYELSASKLAQDVMHTCFCRLAARLIAAALLLVSLPTNLHAGVPEPLGRMAEAVRQLLEDGDAATALQLAEETLAGTRDTYGAGSQEAAFVLASVAKSLQALERSAEAEDTYLEVINLLEAAPRPEIYTPFVLQNAWHELGQLYEAAGQLEKSINARRARLELLDSKGSDAFSAVLTWMKIGDTYLVLKDRRAAETAYQEGAEIVAFVPERLRAVPLFINRRLAFVYRLEERYRESEAILSDGLAQMESIYGRTLEETVLFYEALGLTYYYQSRHEEAGQMANKALHFYKKAGLAASGESVRAMTLKARLLSEPAYKSPTNQSAHALDLLRSALDILRKESGDDSFFYANVLSVLALHHLKQQAFDDAEDVSRRALNIYEDKVGKSAEVTARAQQYLAKALTGQERYAEALPIAQQALATQREGLPPYHHVLGETLSLLSELYNELGKPDAYRAVRQEIATFYEERADFMNGR